MTGDNKPITILPNPEVRKRLGGVSETTLWRMCKDDEFPKPVKISSNRKGWIESEVNDWLNLRAAFRSPDTLAA